MSKSNRFDPEIDKDYGRCTLCGLQLATQDDAREHMNASMSDAKDGRRESHLVMVLNPPREDRVRKEVRWAVAGALDEAIADFERLLRHVSEDEIRQALLGYPDFQDAWEDRCNDQ